MGNTSVIGHRIEMALQDHTPQQLAKKLGISEQSVRAYIRGTRTPKRATIERMAAILDVQAAWLGGYSNDPGIGKAVLFFEDGHDDGDCIIKPDFDEGESEVIARYLWACADRKKLVDYILGASDIEVSRMQAIRSLSDSSIKIIDAAIVADKTNRNLT